ncbi:MAG: carboxylating nicotinate-nucleotide diphosphorylase [Methanomicrobiales archaeon]|nr:carboxylating nicotinate-nucleotide diphosphorylase [Methanomicrobiales archaeon]MDI6875657.1 carboxylating nicotinate-nucleotide diphosphorylase [Methanomicrobiales archaeon]
MIPIDDLLRFIAEDAPAGDVTSEVLVRGRPIRAAILARQKGIVAGTEESAALFSHFGVEVQRTCPDGSEVSADQPLLELSGDAAAIFLVERTALNLIGRMSGIATETHRFVERARALNPRVRVAATRKTCPGLRILDKKAVVLGGGEPHRISLSDAILIKDTHLAILPLEEAVRRAKRASLYRKVEVEVNQPEEAVSAALAGADIVMLDNMPPEAVERTIADLGQRDLRRRIVLEVSGGIDASNFDRFARLDVDVISMGALTHSVRNFDVCLEVLKGAKSFRL